MDLLKTILIYMSLLFVSSVQTMPEPEMTAPPVTQTPAYTAPVTPAATPVPTPGITPNQGYRTLRVGERGDAVRTLQQKLSDLGYYTGEIDGAYGNQTRRAVERFQYSHGLQADGIAGKSTLTVLFESEELRSAAPTDTPAEPPAPTPGAETQMPSQTVPPAQAAESPAVAAPATASPEPAPTTPPGATGRGEPFEMEGYSLRVAGVEGDAGLPLVTTMEGVLFVPIINILRAAGVITVSTESDDFEEYAFAIGDSVYRIVTDVSDPGEGLSLYKNEVPIVLPLTAYNIYDDMLFIPMRVTESALGFTYAYSLDGAEKVYTLKLPDK